MQNAKSPTSVRRANRPLFANLITIGIILWPSMVQNFPKGPRGAPTCQNTGEACSLILWYLYKRP